MAQTSIIWLRRDLQIADNSSIARAIRAGHKIQPVFVFDTDILQNFPNKKDRRVSFLANTIFQLAQQFKERGGSLQVFYGSTKKIIPAFGLPVYAGEDYEPDAIKRDKHVGSYAQLTLTKQHVLLAPSEVLKDDGQAFKVFTPYSNKWKEKLKKADSEIIEVNDKGAYANLKLENALNLDSPQKICTQIGYEYVEDELWQPQNAQKILADFAAHRLKDYSINRDIPAINGTSTISPYLRFGLITPRQAYKVAKDKWLGELIWREFYAMVLYYHPHTVTEEFQPQYRGLKWGHDKKLIAAWKEGKTGYPIVDAGMRQLLQDGWMHNRVRMIVASFLTKDLLQDWRTGEEHFAQLLMDYDAASNIGGWQWAASVGTDAAPYFRVFNPVLQSQKFDPEGKYIKKYLPELVNISAKNIHHPLADAIVERSAVKPKVMEFFKKP